MFFLELFFHWKETRQRDVGGKPRQFINNSLVFLPLELLQMPCRLRSIPICFLLSFDLILIRVCINYILYIYTLLLSLFFVLLYTFREMAWVFKKMNMNGNKLHWFLISHLLILPRLSSLFLFFFSFSLTPYLSICLSLFLSLILILICVALFSIMMKYFTHFDCEKRFYKVHFPRTFWAGHVVRM